MRITNFIFHAATHATARLLSRGFIHPNRNHHLVGSFNFMQFLLTAYVSPKRGLIVNCWFNKLKKKCHLFSSDSGVRGQKNKISPSVSFSLFIRLPGFFIHFILTVKYSVEKAFGAGLPVRFTLQKQISLIG